MLFIQILVGVLGLLGGGELLVRGASRLAVRLGMSPLVVGVTIVGFGTSVPELVTCLEAAWKGAPGIAIGNIVGSNIANILLILGAAAAIRPFMCSRAAIVRDGGLVIATSLAFTLGVIPLMLARGASAETQAALGTGVFGGMITGTLLAVLFVPIFFVVVLSLAERLRGGRA